MTPQQFESTLSKGTKIHMVYEVLKDQQWHCRECEYTHTGITQIAGGSGIQGLQRGTGSRAGLVIESGNHLCPKCDRTTRHDRWQGAFQPSVQGGSMPPAFARRVIALLGSQDVVDNVDRTPSQLTIDHKLPLLRWTPVTQAEQTAYANMDDADVRRLFQLLKKSNGSVSHNLLKSRDCERCYKSGRRGTPFGIQFFYHGGPQWEGNGKKDPKGCVGCGWFDFAKWRKELNKALP